jgi:hypothetical protein
MVISIRSPFENQRKLFGFFASLVLLIILYPILDHHPIFLNLLIVFLFSSIVYELAYDRTHLYTALLFAVPGVAINIIDVFVDFPFLTTLNLILVLIFYCYVAWTILRFVVTAEEVTRDLLFGAVSVYLLLGLCFGVGYVLIDESVPGSFRVADGSEFTSATAFYYSYSTLTTTGYGDVTPHTVPARSAAIIEMALGPLYLAVTVARLVSNYMPGRRLTQKRS